jgi:hypothetical protein
VRAFGGFGGVVRVASVTPTVNPAAAAAQTATIT